MKGACLMNTNMHEVKEVIRGQSKYLDIKSIMAVLQQLYMNV